MNRLLILALVAPVTAVALIGCSSTADTVTGKTAVDTGAQLGAEIVATQIATGINRQVLATGETAQSAAASLLGSTPYPKTVTITKKVGGLEVSALNGPPQCVVLRTSPVSVAPGSC
jgi:hypothetical protein